MLNFVAKLFLAGCQSGSNPKSTRYKLGFEPITLGAATSVRYLEDYVYRPILVAKACLVAMLMQICHAFQPPALHRPVPSTNASRSVGLEPFCDRKLVLHVIQREHDTLP